MKNVSYFAISYHCLNCKLVQSEFVLFPFNILSFFLNATTNETTFEWGNCQEAEKINSDKNSFWLIKVLVAAKNSFRKENHDFDMYRNWKRTQLHSFTTSNSSSFSFKWTSLIKVGQKLISSSFVYGPFPWRESTRINFCSLGENVKSFHQWAAREEIRERNKTENITVYFGLL